MEQKYAALHVAAKEPVMRSSVLRHLQEEFSLEAQIIEYSSEAGDAKYLAEMVKSLTSANYATFLILDLFLTTI